MITGDAENFSVGANLMQLLLSAQEEEWDEVDFAIRAFQRMTAAIKFCPRPVVVAPYSFCLGGGAEIALHGARRQAHAELYMGLVETGVGLVPARRRLQGDAAARAGCGGGGSRGGAERVAGAAGGAAADLRDDRDGQGVDLGGGGAPDRHAAAGRPDHDESRAAVARREGVGARTGGRADIPRRCRAPIFRRRARTCWPR